MQHVTNVGVLSIVPVTHALESVQRDPQCKSRTERPGVLDVAVGALQEHRDGIGRDWGVVGCPAAIDGPLKGLFIAQVGGRIHR